MATVLALASQPVLAGSWASTTAASSGQLTAAVLAHTFTPVAGGGTGGASYATATVLAVNAPRVVDLTNTSTVPVTLTGTVELRSAVTALAATVEACTGTWQTTTTCTGPVVQLLRQPVGAPQAVTWSSAPVPPGGTLHLRFTFSVAAIATLTTTATATPARAPGDRTSA